MTNPQVQELAEKYFPDVYVDSRLPVIVTHESDREKCAGAIREAHELGRTQGPQWIKLTPDTMPPNGIQVLIAVKYLSQPLIHACDAYTKFDLITHWMPLPKPPVE